MAKTHKKTQSTDGVIVVGEEKMERGWVKCPHCSKRVKSKNFARHAKRVHHRELYIEKTYQRMNIKTIAVLVIVIILAVSALGYVFFISPENRQTDNGMDNNPPNEPPLDNNTEWWKSYSPQYSQGSGDDDWWIDYPDQHPDSDSAVNHTGWVLDSLTNKPVIILIHSECYTCNVQYQDMQSVLEEYREEVVYYDLPANGSDDRAYEVFNVYDPDNEQSYIPLTVFVTLIEDGSGNVKVAWHSAEGATGEDWIRSFMKDSIYYYHA
ncbi:MAG: hypothetical protein JSV09_08645 [Thermoplasmata archaeon]|nr:MAG: hypothetical protein JSV09_08645 [Thermoplasmata archaeon]